MYNDNRVQQFLYRSAQTLRVPGRWGSQISRHSVHEGDNFISPTRRPHLTPGNISATHFCQRLSQSQGHSAAGRIISMKSFSDTIGNRTRDFPTWSAVPRPIYNIKIYYSINTYNNMDIMSSMTLIYCWLKCNDMPLFTMCVGICIQTSNIKVFDAEDQISAPCIYVSCVGRDSVLKAKFTE